MIRAGTTTSENLVHHFCQNDRATFTASENAPLEGWVTLAYSDPESEDSSVMVLPAVMFERAAKAYLGVEQ